MDPTEREGRMQQPLNPEIIAEIEKAQREDNWSLVCLLLNKVQASARSRYYTAEEKELDARIKQTLGAQS